MLVQYATASAFFIVVTVDASRPRLIERNKSVDGGNAMPVPALLYRRECRTRAHQKFGVPNFDKPERLMLDFQPSPPRTVSFPRGDHWLMRQITRLHRTGFLAHAVRENRCEARSRRKVAHEHRRRHLNASEHRSRPSPVSNFTRAA